MKVLILGGGGMAGHLIKELLLETTDCEVWWTVRDSPTHPRAMLLDASKDVSLRHLIEYVSPDVVINAIGILNQVAEQNLVTAIRLNSLLPHHLALLADVYRYRLIHISTDCVFSGATGPYAEDDPMDGTSVYAKTKSLGEVTASPSLTIRTSIVGPELKANGIGLFHWFMQQTGDITGYQNVRWNGVTTLELAKFVHKCLTNNLMGLVHLCHPTPISKYELLTVFDRVFPKLGRNIIPASRPVSNKTLHNTRADVSWDAVEYTQMIQELRDWMNSHAKEAYLYAT